MKKFLIVKLSFLLTFHSTIVMAQVASGIQQQTYVNCDPEDHLCQSQNRAKEKVNNYVNQAQNQANQVYNGGAGTDPNSQRTSGIVSSNSKEGAAADNLSAEQKKTIEENAKKTSTTDSMGNIASGAQKDKTMFALIGAAAVGMAVKQVFYATQCGWTSFGVCVPPLLAAAAAFMILNKKAGDAGTNSNDVCKQAADAKAASSGGSPDYSACSTASTGGGGGGGGGMDPLAMADPIADGWLDENGNCKATAPASCAAALRDLEARKPGIGKVIGNTKGSQVAGLKSRFKQNPDGSVIDTKTGKTYNESDFANLSSLTGLGLSPAEAKKLAGEMAGLNGLTGSAKADLKDLNKGGKEYSSDYTSGGKVNINSIDSGGKSLSNDALANDRKPSSSEGLTKEFNGELIGVANDDIFTMMNRRYKLKNEQDSFIP